MKSLKRKVKRSAKKITNELTMPKNKKEEKEMVSMYDPTVDAYREVPLELAKKFIESAEELKEKYNL